MRQLFLLLGIITIATSACQHAAIRPYETVQCLCAGSCPADRCNFIISLSATCKGRADLAEVLIDTYLEEGVATPTKPLLSCYSIPVGSKASIFVRGDDWEWGPQEESCTPSLAGKAISLVLDCCECITDADCAAAGKTSCLNDCLCGL